MISTKGRYALRLMIDIAEHSPDGPVRLKDAAQRQDISLQYAQILARTLVAEGYLEGSSGKGGGYHLLRDPKDCCVMDILECMEGSMSAVACIACPKNTCERQEFCKTLPMWKQFDEITKTFFSHITLEDLIERDLPAPVLTFS